jgi:choline dehydrogenase-like flavoprotein
MKNVIVVGSGAGGATVARELAKNRIKVTLLEKGCSTPVDKAHQYYDNLDVGVELLKTTCLGGTTLVTAGNAVRTCQEEFKEMESTWKMNSGSGGELMLEHFHTPILVKVLYG